MPSGRAPGCFMAKPRGRHVVIGEVAGVYGVRGWIRVKSYTDPIDNIFAYRPWQLGTEGSWVPVDLDEGRRHGRGLIAKLAGVDDRDAAAGLHGKLIGINRKQLPDADDEYYWADLEGLEVVTRAGESLGNVHHLLETGANDVLVVRGERERLIPFLRGEVVKDIDLAAGRMTVDWDPDF